MTRNERNDPRTLRPWQGRWLLRDAPWRRVIVMGDSIAEGIGDAVPGYRDVSWADQLVDTLRAAQGSVAYRNLGQRGLRAREILLGQLDAALAFEPDLVVVSAGANDMLSRSFDPAAVREALDAIVTPLRATGADVLTFSIFNLSAAPFTPDEARDGLRELIGSLVAVTADVAERRGCVYVDLFRHPAAGESAIWSADHLHVNRRGHAIVTAEFVRALGARTQNATLERALVDRASARGGATFGQPISRS